MRGAIVARDIWSAAGWSVWVRVFAEQTNIAVVSCVRGDLRVQWWVSQIRNLSSCQTSGPFADRYHVVQADGSTSDRKVSCGMLDSPRETFPWLPPRRIL